jgi:hypothetical protein
VGAVEFAGWRAAGYDGGSAEADPLLDGSYHLRAGSLAVDAGRAMLELGVDYDGNVRTGIPDIGADEFGAGQILTAPPPSGVVGTGALPAIESVVINAGSVQRSTVTEITITFDTEVDTSLLATAFSLTRTTDGVTVGAIAVTTEMSAGRRTVARLTFTGASTRAGSLDDGRWTLTVDHSKVRAGAGSEMAADFGLQLHRLFGDSNGDGDVDNGDLLQFRSTFGKTATQSGYASHFDIDQDGDIDNGDLLQFRYRFGQQV